MPVVNGWIGHLPAQHQQRLAHINDFERLLSETGTVVLKFARTSARKSSASACRSAWMTPPSIEVDQSDLAARAQWDGYQRAYEQLLAATHTPWAPDDRARRFQDPPQPQGSPRC
ncbi:MAG: hypothetical protein U1E57_09495 [Paenacidovorax caeni]